jgi:hypothetical protein
MVRAMSDQLIGIVVYAVVRLVMSAHSDRTSTKMLAELRGLRVDLRAIKGHLGIEVDAAGKVLMLRRSATATSDYEAAKP